MPAFAAVHIDSDQDHNSTCPAAVRGLGFWPADGGKLVGRRRFPRQQHLGIVIEIWTSAARSNAGYPWAAVRRGGGLIGEAAQRYDGLQSPVENVANELARRADEIAGVYGNDCRWRWPLDWLV